MLNTLSYSLPTDIEQAVKAELEDWRSASKVERLWKKDASLWTGDDEAKWLGWLDIVHEELAGLDKYRSLAADIADAGFTEILLMGMGGSSLCPEVLAMTFGKTNFHILDSTVPAQIKAVEDKLDLERTLFIVASKSGSTLEPNCFKQYFFERLAERVGRENAGKQFIAITDPGSKMAQVAKGDGFRHIFYGKPEIGGRFSALSAFGMTAAAAMALNVEQFLLNAKIMAEWCRKSEFNYAAELGIVLGICQKAGRDKLTIFTSNDIRDVGAWMEQLIAESTGKNGVAIIPVDREPILADRFYGDDRVFVYLTTSATIFDDPVAPSLQAIELANNPMITIRLGDTGHLGQEFFRWEFATAVAGSVMGINPFNQPDVEAAKIEARKLTDEYEKTGVLPDEKPFFESEGLQFFSSEEHAAKLSVDAPAAMIRSHLDQIGKGDYFGLLAYVEMKAEHDHLLQQLREAVLMKYGCATCLGFGPRFLHSTGQAYKGGSNNGVFLQITSDDAFDLPVPGQKYTFGVVKAAQARGDFQVLLDRGRRALRIHLGADVKGNLERLAGFL